MGADGEAAEGQLAWCAQVEHGAQPEGADPVEVGSGQLVEAVAAVEPPEGDLPPVGRAVPAEVPEVEDRVERDVAGRDANVDHRHGANVRSVRCPTLSVAETPEDASVNISGPD